MLNAPIPFLAAMLFVGWLIWRYADREYSTRLANANSEIALLERRVQHQDRDEAIAVATAQVRAASTVSSPPLVSKSPLPATIVAPNADQNEYINLSANQMIEIVDAETELTAQQMFAEHVGKWLRVRGVVANVTAGGLPDTIMVGIYVEASTWRMVFCHFPDSSDEAKALAKDQTISVEGRLQKVNSLGINLIDCRLSGSAA